MSQIKYEQKINKVLTYICQNITEEFTVDRMAKISGFSKFHFLRIFKALTNETLGEFIRRVKLEKAAYQLIYNSSLSITEIAYNINFSSSQNFAKAFKLHFGCSPTEYRKTNKNRKMVLNSNSGNIISNTGKDNSIKLHYNDIIKGTKFRIKPGEMIQGKVQIKDLPDMSTASLHKVAHYSPQTISPLIMRLIEWAAPRELTNSGKLFCVFWDNSAVTPEDKQMFDACITIPKGYKTGSVVHKKNIKGGKFAVYNCSVIDNNFYDHWNYLLRDWFPLSGYQPGEGPSLEFYNNIFEESAAEYLDVDICIPIKEF